MEGRIPLLPREHLVPVQHSLPVGVGLWAPWQWFMLFRHSRWRHLQLVLEFLLLVKGDSVLIMLTWVRYDEARCRSRERNRRFTVLLQLPGENTVCHTGPLKGISGVRCQAQWGGEEWAGVFPVVSTGRKG